MERRLKSSHFFVSILFVAYVCQGNEVDITKSPSGISKRGSEVTITCHLPANMATQSVAWSRRMGLIEEQIAENNILKSSYKMVNRYKLLQAILPDSSVQHKLVIKDLQYVDTAEIGCKNLEGTDPAIYETLTVCDDPEAEWCQCVLKQKWNDPGCFQKPQSVKDMQAKYKWVETGLGVCLAIAVIYGIGMTIMASIDCIQRLNAKRIRKLQLRKAHGSRDPYEDAETLHIDGNDTESQISYEGLRSRIPEANLSPIPPVLERDAAPPYTKLMQNIQPVPHTHINKAFQEDDVEPKYQEIESGATRGTYERPPAAAKGVLPSDSLQSNYAGSGGQMLGTGGPQRAAAFMPAPGMHYAQDGYPEKSPGTWSTQSAQMPPAIGFKYPDTVADYNVQRNAYSDRQPREYSNRSGYTAPKKLDFVSGKMNGAAGYQNLSSQSPQNGAPSWNGGPSQNGGPQVNMSDTVV